MDGFGMYSWFGMRVLVATPFFILVRNLTGLYLDSKSGLTMKIQRMISQQ